VSVTLDRQALFDERDLQIEVGSEARACVERAVCGLDGMLSIDLGRRPRQIRQKGTLRAASRAALRSRVDAIAAFLDGTTHTLVAADGTPYAELRLDVFRQQREQVEGPGFVVAYEIIYTQLGG